MPSGSNDSVRQSHVILLNADSYILIKVGIIQCQHVSPEGLSDSKVVRGRRFWWGPSLHLSLGKNATQHLQDVSPKPSSLPTLPNSLCPSHSHCTRTASPWKGVAWTAVRSPLLLLLRAMVTGLGCQTLTHRHCTGELGLCFLPCNHCSNTSEKSQGYSFKSRFHGKWQLSEGNLAGSFPKRLEVSWNSISLGWHWVRTRVVRSWLVINRSVKDPGFAFNAWRSL